MKAENQTKKIFIGGVPSNLSKKQVFTYFLQIIPDLEILELPLVKSARRSSKPRNRGFAILHLKDEAIYKNLIEKKFLYMENRKITLKKYLKGEQLESKKKNELKKRIFIANLLQKRNLNEIKNQLESKYGEIEDIFRLVNPITKKAKACAFCFFSDEKSAKQALLDGEMTTNFNDIVYFHSFDGEMCYKFKSKFEPKKSTRSFQKPELNLEEEPNHHLKPNKSAYYLEQGPKLLKHQAHNLKINRKVKNINRSLQLNLCSWRGAGTY